MKENLNFSYFIPTKIWFGPGSLEKLREEKLPGRKALIVISAGGSMKRLGYLDRLTDILKSKGVEYVVFDKILPNPIKKHVMEGAQIAREEKCDFVIGLGGGSSIDSAKSIALMAKNDGDYWDYIVGGTGKGKKPEKGALPIVAITTTAGTGTEADPWTVITNEETNEKIGYGNEYTFPTLSIVDPELMLSVPPHLTAYQGFDAFFHAVEGYIANIATPVSDLYALKSVELIAKYLPVCVKNGSDLTARTYVALANTLSGFVESTSSCTSEHSMEHALSAFHPELPHGAGLIMLSEAYHTFFASKIPERYINLARAMGVDVDSLPEEERPFAFVKALKKLQEECGVANLKMSDYGIKEDEIEKLAKNAMETMGGLFEMDRYKLSFEEVVEIMRKAYK
ncbi:iron-containing alcohol dehydrogenase [Dictyoglomus thermophilum]|uniref:Alcohol dehydrogenase II n=3 Tax=Pseudomonadati TaxID=3379134 RepID=B5YAY3_DICT6|nr:iron-containing alcohol dehydrogenase [Dictyoglomus thermophilum]ACI19306.1 alcohol dehydrogenase II [Dictyoglomus thermophilum H-6-12]MCX7720904.1 iron-containing alcohol dehydrogenase [Dictyoglomus thermophilum]